MYGAWKEAEEKRADEEERKSKLFHFLRKHYTPDNRGSAIENIRIQTDQKVGVYSAFFRFRAGPS